jgi:hypothetical protein
VFREVLRAIHGYRQNKKGQDTYVANLPSTITISLADYSSHIRNDLASALADIDPPDLIERIRECPVLHCQRLFWAGRDDKKACDKHVGLWRKRENRKEIKKRESAADAKRRNADATKTLEGMTRTARSVIRAIMDKSASDFYAIDGESWHEFFDDGRVPRSKRVIRLVTHKLYKDGYLEYHESAERRDRYGFSDNDRYYPTQKLIDLWTASQREKP